MRMKWSWKIGRFAGIDVYVHASFVLLLGWIALTHYLGGQSLATTLRGLIFVLALFLCVVLHEFGHALTARRYGVETRDIILLPIGGLARLERIPDEPRQELAVAAAGPAVNVVIAALLYAGLRLGGGLEPLSTLALTEGPLLQRLMVANVFLVVFNLIPAFPMDGGRMLRALLAMRLEYVRATRIAAAIGQALAFGFGFLGLFTNPFLILIAFFVWIGASQEAGQVQMRSMLHGVSIDQVMVTDFQALTSDQSLRRAVELTLAGSQKDFPVIDETGRVVGILTQGDLLRGLKEHGEDAPVERVMERDFEQALITEELDQALLRFQKCACRTLPVLRGEQIVGLLTLENVGELVSIRSALHGAREGASPAIAHDAGTGEIRKMMP